MGWLEGCFLWMSALQQANLANNSLVRVLGRQQARIAERVFSDPLGTKEKGAPFVVTYVHTYVSWLESFVGVSTLGFICESLAPTICDNLKAIYFVHSDLQPHFFFATFSHFSSMPNKHKKKISHFSLPLPLSRQATNSS
ncbi:hypothetical protein Taro_019509 [Colocasia esculenta]|uniref:CRAL-TRIO domain-containing protein n=1 Tax=Colocasia esculenta TaxID=4460 RepID=A0A843UWZ2_COLES|nr:hypothetical protein [Colocasia esculenta]